jgi:malate dehydrogenase (oxaloacetate-decarboxylating)
VGISVTQPAISLTMVLRIEMPNEPGAFGVLANAIGDAGGSISAVDMHTVGRTRIVRDVTIGAASDAVANEVRRAVEAIEGARIIFSSDSTFLAHIGGKIRIDSKITIKSRQDLSTVYTPGVARVSMAIAADPSKAFQLTIKRNMVAVVTDGTAVLGL